jgi:hypothetical protein
MDRIRALAAVVAGLACLGCGRLGFEEVAVGGDGAAPDASAADGAAAPDGGAAAAACPEPDATTLALLSFDGALESTVPDATGDHDGMIVGDGAASVPGPSECGEAIAFADGTYVVIPDAPIFQLPAGSISFWARVPAPVGIGAGMVSRDETGQNTPGHLTVWYTAEGRFATRLQDVSAGGQMTRCGAEELVPGTWYHVGVNFGGGGDFELWVDGVEQLATGLVLYGGGDLACDDGSFTIGIDGNQNPWVLGASSAKSSAGAAGSITEPFTGGALDHLIISEARSDFGAL